MCAASVCLSVCQSTQAWRMHVCVIYPCCSIGDEQIFPKGLTLISFYPPPLQIKNKNQKIRDQSTERLLQYVACVLCWSVAVCRAKLFWMGPSHLVTTAETDRGVVGQSGVGVLNELSCIQQASVSRGMNEWPDSLFTSSFLSDFPSLLPPASFLPPSFQLCHSRLSPKFPNRAFFFLLTNSLSSLAPTLHLSPSCCYSPLPLCRPHSPSGAKSYLLNFSSLSKIKSRDHFSSCFGNASTRVVRDNAWVGT